MRHVQQTEHPWPCFYLAVPGIPDLFLCRDGGVAFALPPEQHRPTGDACCDCRFCKGRPAYLDTIRVHASSEGWMVHWPELQKERDKERPR